MLPRSWHVQAKNPDDIIQTLLTQRGITNESLFFNPPPPEAFSLKELGISQSQMKKVLARLKKAKENKEVVVIYGDYDADGVCATSLLWEALNSFGITVFPFVPDRFSDGYGMSRSGVDKILTQYPTVSLLITVDNGISAGKIISEVQAQGIDVIVTDHHEKSEETPAYACVHSTLICGTAVSWIVSRELEIDPKKGLDLVGIATIADQMNLTNLNRSFALHGIAQLRKSTRVGLKALCEFAQIDQSKIGTYEIGFVIGPRLNAAGRLAHAIDVVRLLCTTSQVRAFEIAQTLSSLNIKRQDITFEVLQNARAQIESGSKVIIIKGQFHEGVIGLAAGKIVEETGKPAIVLSEHEAVLKGSARSIKGFHITETLLQFKDLFLSVGGHEMAAGLSMDSSKFDEFVKAVTAHVDQTLTDEQLEKKLTIDCLISFEKINRELSRKLLQMEPFGAANPKPLFLSEKVKVSSLKMLGSSGDHMKLSLTSQNMSFDALLFRISQYKIVPKLGNFIDLVYSIEENTWNGKTTIQLMTKDFHIYDEPTKPPSAKGVSETSSVAS